MISKPIYFSGLNGIRAFAAISVLISHVTLALSNFGLDSNIFGYSNLGKVNTLDLAGYGVTIFFVLSGFLITYLLIEEKSRTKTIKVRKFYWRRLLRIWPLYFLYFFLSILTVVLYGIKFNSDSTFYYLFFAANIPFILGTTLPFLSHYWSLAVEEQFYIFWPLASKCSKRYLLVGSIILTLLLIFVKCVAHIFFPNSFLELVIRVSRFHCILIGAIAALLYYSKNKYFINLTTSRLAQILTWVVMVVIAINKFHFISFLDNEFVSIVAVFLIMSQIGKNPILSLENKIFNYLGKISFGIYVYHPLLIFFLSKVLYTENSKSLLWTVLVYLASIFFTVLVANFSYEYFEKFFLIYKRKKFTIIESTSTKR